jgi:4-alpha-glucanotransferase
MVWPSLIDRIATLAGIETSYFDIHGERHDTALDTKAQVLNALGVDVSSLAACERSLLELEGERWRRRVPQTIFCDAGAPNVSVDLILPEGDRRTWRWDLELETGDSLSGEFRAKALEFLDERNVGGRKFERRRLVVAEPMPAGYHHLRIAGRTKADATIVAAPRRCYLPAPLEGGVGLWGLAAHVYSLRSQDNWGIGDFEDLRRLTGMAAQAGASFVAVNPFHALLPGRPEHASPYSPSSRLFVNPLYIGLKGATCGGDLRDPPFVDYTRVWSAKGPALEDLAKAEAGTSEADFDAFCRQGGAALENFAAFAALSESFKSSWHAWPARYRKPEGSAVKRFAADRADRVRVHKQLQFFADRQLRTIEADADKGGMSIGLIRDLALGVDPDGADAWAYQGAFVGNLRCGAPRDDFHPGGQEWGVLPLNPIHLRADYQTYAQLLRANMRHAGGLRIDHIIGIDRQFVVPLGGTPAQGCYLRYPTSELMSLIALESQRNKCMVIGEDLGTVPEGLRQRMHDAKLFGCSILYFERGEGGTFRAPAAYRRHTMASAGTHDLPTIAGHWAGRDIEARAAAGIQSDQSASAMLQRAEGKRLLLEALSGAGLFVQTQGDEPTAESLRNAVHAFLSLSGAQLFAAQIDDLFDEFMQLNLPGTVEQYPNWRRKLRAGLDDPAFTRALNALSHLARARSVSPPQPA